MQTFKSLALKVFYFSLLFAIIGNLVAEFFFSLQCFKKKRYSPLLGGASQVQFDWLIIQRKVKL